MNIKQLNEEIEKYIIPNFKDLDELHKYAEQHFPLPSKFYLNNSLYIDDSELHYKMYGI